MELTETQYNRLLTRLTKLEETVNDILAASKSYVTSGQVQQLMTILTTQTDDLSETVSSLEERVESLEEDALN